MEGLTEGVSEAVALTESEEVPEDVILAETEEVPEAVILAEIEGVLDTAEVAGDNAACATDTFCTTELRDEIVPAA